MFDLTVKVKGDDATLSRKFLVYEENVQLNHDDPILKKHIESTLKDFKGNVEDVIVNIRVSW